MNHLVLNILLAFAKISDVNPAILDLGKILLGSIIWIGGLTSFMWYREKNKKTA